MEGGALTHLCETSRCDLAVWYQSAAKLAPSFHHWFYMTSSSTRLIAPVWFHCETNMVEVLVNAECRMQARWSLQVLLHWLAFSHQRKNSVWSVCQLIIMSSDNVNGWCGAKKKLTQDKEMQLEADVMTHDLGSGKRLFSSLPTDNSARIKGCLSALRTIKRRH